MRLSGFFIAIGLNKGSRLSQMAEIRGMNNKGIIVMQRRSSIAITWGECGGGHGGKNAEDLCRCAHKGRVEFSRQATGGVSGVFASQRGEGEGGWALSQQSSVGDLTTTDMVSERLHRSPRGGLTWTFTRWVVGGPRVR